ncbi:cell division protein FtsK [Bacillus sp. AFS076308]|uniref:FtsK/SpoIIIE domain-containing protein n=1 Tax=unclassified Bacillus (in: firmicutes) TaxID=185979 RepID=UPI000BF3921F|nr:MULTISPECIES: FtsK/SpoIIIE domain-containing protein [unclassified Bacillus (in: firmicutes)]PFN77593.1 cell division protein FtsK [Bacillus sp. AFS076308]PGV45324.1 cell division protein FtsK [Bacillus sp. AFS037270]
MIFEVVTTTIFGVISLKAYRAKSGVGNDSKKINKIFALSGLNVKDGNQTLTAQQIKKRNYDWGVEYRYRIPLGRSFEDYLAKQKVIESGINTRSVKIKLKDLKELKLDRNIFSNIKSLYTKKLTDRKEIELSYDGMLIIRVYNEPLPKIVGFQEGKGWKVVFGATRDRNKLIFHDFEKIPHLCLGGATRYGKSNLINCIITSLIKQQPDNVKLHLIDLKGGVELCDYENIKQTVSIAYEPEEALKTLENAYNLMKKKQEILKQSGKKKVEDAEITERHFVIIDEVGELNPDEAVDKKDIWKDGILIYKSEKTIKAECQKYMSQIARLGAGLGFRLILATQYGTGDIIPRQCKQNSDAKLCFRVQSGTASRVVLDTDGAEALPKIKGRAIYQMADEGVIVQTPLITPEDIEKTITPYIVQKREVVTVEAPKQETGRNSIVITKTGLS